MADGGDTTAQRSRPPRVLIPSLRRVRHHPVFSAAYECQDVIASVTEADVAELEFRNATSARLAPLTEKVVRRVGRRPVGFPYYEPVELADEYDVLFEFVVGLPEVEALDGLPDWRRRCRTTVLFIWELWPASLEDFRAFYKGLDRFDHIYVGTQMVAEQLSDRLGRDVRWLPPGTDVLRFRPKAPGERTIDILSLGRRSDAQHQAASQLRDDLGWHYIYDTASDMSIEDHVEHRTLVAENLSRAKFFVSNRGKFNDSDESAGVHDFGNRFFDGTAAGTVVVGEFAKTTGFSSCFDWGDIGIDLRANDPTLAKVLADAAADTGWMAEVSIRNASESARRHDWAHRWATVLDDLGLDHGPTLRDRLAQLDARSAEARDPMTTGAAQAAGAHRPVGGPGSIVIPAHNEETVIGRCLTALFDELPDGVEVVVAANGCTDRTVDVARGTDLAVTVLDLPEPGKIGALNAGDAAVHSFPRIYLDADVVLTGRMADDVLTALRDGAVAARPPVRFDTSASSAIVRSFYRARTKLPTLMHELCIGGFYSLSADARSRFERFPDIVADDLFVGRIVDEGEVTIVDTDPYVVRVPSDTRSLLKIMRRSFRGNQELATVRPDLQRQTTGSNVSALVHQMTSPQGFVDAVVYASIVIAARIWARWRPASVRWERDDSSRTAA